MSSERRALVAGWFSFPYLTATAGDLMARDVLCEWLERAGVRYDVALDEPFEGGVRWQLVDPGAYSDLIFVCGPVAANDPASELFRRFASCRLSALNTTMIDPPAVWNPFDLLVERDSTRAARPDISLASRQAHVPVIGVILVERHRPHYPGRDRQEVAREAVRRLAERRQAATVQIDTRLDENSGGLRTAAEVESLIARMDAVVTTRLHGLVLALKNHVPAVAVDGVADGAKVRAQAETLGWPAVLTADAITDEALDQALDYCLSDAGRERAHACGEAAKRAIDPVREEFMAAFDRITPPDADARLTFLGPAARVTVRARIRGNLRAWVAGRL